MRAHMVAADRWASAHNCPASAELCGAWARSGNRSLACVLPASIAATSRTAASSGQGSPPPSASCALLSIEESRLAAVVGP